MEGILKELPAYQQIIVAVHDYRKRPLRDLDYNDELKLLIKRLSSMNSISCLFANPYCIAGLPGIEQSKTLIVNYQNSVETQRAVAKVLAGRMQANGKLPVNVAPYFRTGQGLEYFPVPEAASGQLSE